MMVAPYRFAGLGGVAVDPNYASVSLLAGFNSTGTPVEKGGPATFSGNAAISTAQKKFGTSSLLLDGSGDYVEVPTAAGLQGSAGQFTIEGWAYCTGGAVNSGCIAAQWDAGFTNVSWAFYVSGGTFYFRFYDPTNTIRDTSTYIGNFPQNTWVHYAADRDAAGKIRLYVNGVMVTWITWTQQIHTSGNNVRLGTAQGATGLDWLGYIDEVRITKGVARYASDAGFSLAAAEFPRG